MFVLIKGVRSFRGLRNLCRNVKGMRSNSTDDVGSALTRAQRWRQKKCKRAASAARNAPVGMKRFDANVLATTRTSGRATKKLFECLHIHQTNHVGLHTNIHSTTSSSITVAGLHEFLGLGEGTGLNVSRGLSVDPGREIFRVRAS